MCLFALKLLTSDGVMVLYLPDIKKWGMGEVNAIYLFSSIFRSIYLYRYVGEDTGMAVICHQKKNISSSVLLHNRLYYILSNQVNLFSKQHIVDNFGIASKILKLIKDPPLELKHSSMINDFINTLM
jgi:hypothetical protein